MMRRLFFFYKDKFSDNFKELVYIYILFKKTKANQLCNRKETTGTVLNVKIGDHPCRDGTTWASRSFSLD